MDFTTAELTGEHPCVLFPTALPRGGDFFVSAR